MLYQDNFSTNQNYFFIVTAATEIYTLSLHDALPIYHAPQPVAELHQDRLVEPELLAHGRSEEHTSELQSRLHLVCRLLLEKKNSKTSSSNSCFIKIIFRLIRNILKC